MELTLSHASFDHGFEPVALHGSTIVILCVLTHPEGRVGTLLPTEEGSSRGSTVWHIPIYVVGLT